ncbi:hypothetical protein EDF58_106499 [Novosphingobium sp. PhB57]|uniref:DUF6118 family protein n=1 Tax=Novosphingobium sp. PhB57 TaxID=2485107 RepID=UPI0010536BB7|nr:DUF6118 family protein [Novosphingobium sp. PhB57]TCU56202.1 hypothetical protein EDF58_106499 [Novosphingobium sp. PhB57]
MPQNQTPEELDPAAAFEVMGQRLAGLTAAIDGLAVKFQEVHGRDYSPELARIDARFEAVRDFVDQLMQKPAMALTPEKIAAEIEAAGRNGRQADHAAWHQAQTQLNAATKSISRVVGSALEEQRQFKWLMIAAGVALVSGVVLGSIVPPMIDRQMPESWQWPEQRAADILNRDRWAAGERLLEVSDAERWSKVKAALQSLEDKSAEVGKREKPEAGRGKNEGARGRDRRRSK